MKAQLLVVFTYGCLFVFTVLGQQENCPCRNSSAQRLFLYNDMGEISAEDSLLYTIDCLGWRRLVLIMDAATGSGQALVDSLFSRQMVMTVFQLSSTGNTTSTTSEAVTRNVTLLQNVKALETVTFSFRSAASNVVVYGSSAFVRFVFKEIAQLENQTVVSTNHWLTVASRDCLHHIIGNNILEHVAVITRCEGSLSLWTKLRQGDVTRPVKVQEWPFFENCAETEDTVFPNIKHGLGGRTLQVVTIPMGLFMIRQQTKNGTQYKGLAMDLLHYIAESLNFTYEIRESVDGNWGHQLENGTWVGMTGMLQRKEVDLALAIFSVTAPRATVSDYTIGFFHDDLVLLATRPTGGSPGLNFFLQPFQHLVYGVIAASLVVVTALHVVLERLGTRLMRSEEEKSSPMARQSIFTSIIQGGETFLGALIGRCVVFESQLPATQMLMFSWLVMSLVTVATYTGKLTAFSVLTQEKIPFTTIREVVRQTEYRWGFLAGTMDADILKSSTNEDFARYYQGALQFAEDDPSVLSSDLEVQVSKVAAGQYVFFTAAAPGYHMFKSRYCQITMLPERLFTTTYAIHLQKGSPYTQRFSEVIDKAKELGLLEFWLRKWYPQKTDCEGKEGAHVVTVTLDLVQAAFLLAAMGMGLAALVLGVERLAAKCCRGRSQRQDHGTAPRTSAAERPGLSSSEDTRL